MSELPNGWTICPLADVIDILDYARSPINSKEREERISGKPRAELFPYYGATGKVGEIDGFLFDEELVLLGEDGVPFFDRFRSKAYLVRGRFWVNNHAHVLRGRSGVTENRYLTSFLNNFDYTGYVSGSTRLKLTQESMRSIPVALPPFSEQRRIADKLDSLLPRVDTCRERLDRVLGILKRFRQAVLAAATSGELTREWRKSREIGLESWESLTMAQLLDGKPRNGYSPRAVENQTNVKSLTLTATTTGRFRGEYFKYIDEDIPSDSHLWLQPGDILVQRANTIEYVGVSAIYDGPAFGYIYPDLMMKCRANGKVRSAYLHLILSSEPVRKYFREHATGTAGNMPKINQQTVMEAPACLPPLLEQDEIVRRVEALFSLLDQLAARYEAAVARVQRITPSVLSKAFRGELVPQDPNDEPASELLARIRAAGTEPSAPKRGRKPAAGNAPRPPREKSTMAKTRNDDDVRNKDYLATLLRLKGGSLKVDDLFRDAELSVTDFYKQLAWEIEHGHIRDDATKLEVV